VSTSIGNEIGEQHLKLLNEELHCPENAKTDAQKLLIYHYLYCQWKLCQYTNGIITTLPPIQTIYVEGLPGTGKTFIINTLCNIVKIIFCSNVADAASAPKGCAAALIDRSTHVRMMKIPVGREAAKAPLSIQTTNLNQLKYLHDKFRSLITILMDEHMGMDKGKKTSNCNNPVQQRWTKSLMYCSPTYGMRIHEACCSGLTYPIT
jgi:hypothetical protein